MEKKLRKFQRKLRREGAVLTHYLHVSFRIRRWFHLESGVGSLTSTFTTEKKNQVIDKSTYGQPPLMTPTRYNIPIRYGKNITGYFESEKLEQ